MLLILDHPLLRGIPRRSHGGRRHKGERQRKDPGNLDRGALLGNNQHHHWLFHGICDRVPLYLPNLECLQEHHHSGRDDPQ